MTRTCRLPMLTVCGVLLCLSRPLWCAEPDTSAQSHLDAFIQQWDESAWLEKSFRTPDGYMRALDDPGWKARLLAIRKLVAEGQSSVGVLVDALNSREAPVRMFAAQTLGYLSPHVPEAPLWRAARQDDDPAVRLYAVDALGMQGKRDVAVDWDALLEAEENRDVRKHIGYAMERNGKPLEPGVVKKLIDWDPKTIDSARVGEPAPDFELTAATGETLRLSDYRGKKSVVLVFIYGDT